MSTQITRMPFLGRILFAALLLWLMSLQIQAQEEDTVESKEAQLQLLAMDDEARVPLLTKLVQSCWRACPHKAEKYGNETLELLKKWPSVEHESTVLMYLPRIYLRRADYDRALSLIYRGLEVAKQQDNKSALAGIQFNLAIYYSDQKQFILAQNAYERLYDTYKELEHKNGMGSALNNLGRIHRREHNYGKALELYQQALEIYQQANVIHNHASTLTNIGEIYRLIGDLEMAETSITEALSNIEAADYPNIHTWASVSLAGVYIDQHRYEEATNILLQSLSNYEEINVRYSAVEIYAKLAKAAVRNQQLDKALEYYQSGMSRLPEDVPENDELSFKEVEVELNIAQDQLAKAEAVLTPIFNSIQSGDFSDQKFSLFRTFIDVLNLQEKWQESARLLLLYLEQYQAQVQVNRDSRLEQFNTIFKASERERQIALLQQQNNEKSLKLLNEQAARKQTFFVSIIVSIALFVVIYMGIQKRKVLKMETLLLQLEAAKKRRLFSEISHELRTPLSVLKLQVESLEYDLEDDPRQAYQRLHSKLASMNNIIGDISQLAKADAGELQLAFQNTQLRPFFQSWCEEAADLPEQNGLHFSHDIDLNDALSARMDPERIKQVLNNLLSNSCRYTDAPGDIRFSVNSEDGNIHCTLEDSAPGLAEDQLKQIFDRLYSADEARSQAVGGSGLGLAICKSFVEAHKGQITAAKSEFGGIKLKVILPLNNGD